MPTTVTVSSGLTQMRWQATGHATPRLPHPAGLVRPDEGACSRPYNPTAPTPPGSHLISTLYTYTALPPLYHYCRPTSSVSPHAYIHTPIPQVASTPSAVYWLLQITAAITILLLYYYYHY